MERSGVDRSQEVMQAQWQSWPTTCWPLKLEGPFKVVSSWAKIARPLYSLINQSWLWSVPWRVLPQARQPSVAEAVPEGVISSQPAALPDSSYSLKGEMGSTTQDPPLLCSLWWLPISLRIKSKVFIISLWPPPLLLLFPSITLWSHVCHVAVS